MKNVFRTLTAFVLCFTFTFTFFIHASASELEVVEQDYSTLFQQAADAGDDLTDLASALSEALHYDPIGFLNALYRQDTTFQDAVGSAIVTYHSERGEELEFLEFLLTVFASDGLEMGVFFPFFIGVHADISGADDEFVTALLNAKRYSDGYFSDKLGIYIYELFIDDPVRMLHRFFKEDEEFREHMLAVLQYQSDNQDEKYISVLNDLSNNSELSEEEKAFVSKLMEELETTPSESEEATDPTVVTTPTEDIDATEPPAPSAPKQDDPVASGVPTGGIIAAAIALAVVVAALAVYLKKKPH